MTQCWRMRRKAPDAAHTAERQPHSIALPRPDAAEQREIDRPLTGSEFSAHLAYVLPDAIEPINKCVQPLG